MKEYEKKLEEMLQESAEAHHQAYLDVDGVDPNWSMFYAPFMIVHGLQVPVSAQELSDQLNIYDTEFVEQNLKGAWQPYYAKRMLEDYPTLIIN